MAWKSTVLMQRLVVSPRLTACAGIGNPQIIWLTTRPSRPLTHRSGTKPGNIAKRPNAGYSCLRWNIVLDGVFRNWRSSMCAFGVAIMTRFLPGICVAVLGGALSLIGLAQAVAAPTFMPNVEASKPEIIRISDSVKIIRREGAHIVRPDRHREPRIERSARPHQNGDKVAHRRHQDKRFAYRGQQNDRLGYNRATEGGVRLGYNRSLEGSRFAYDHRPDREYIYRYGDEGRYEQRDFYGDDNWNGNDEYRHKKRLYKMQSFGYETAPQQGPLNDILTAVPK
jgi:hypothetical protein